MFRTPNNGLRKHARDNSENTITDTAEITLKKGEEELVLDN